MKFLLLSAFGDRLAAFGDIFLDAFRDCLKMLPFIFITYVIIELVERKAKFAENGRFLTGRAAPLLGSLAGAFPSCGISVMSAKLFDKDIIRIGTLLAVFVSTSDEAFSILVSGGKWAALGMLILVKLLFAVIVGYAANAVFRKQTADATEDFSHEEICAHCHNHVEEDEHGKKAVLERYVLVPLIHSLQTFLYVFAVAFVFGIFFGEGGIVGAEAFEEYLKNARYFEPLLTALIGLIPNCASSAVITSAYLSGAISFGSMAGGLCANAGVGLAVLFKNGKKIKRNVLLLLSLYLIGVIVGFAVNIVFSALGVSFV